MLILILIAIILVLSFSCVITMVYKLKRQPSVSLPIVDVVKLFISGVVAFIADTIGVGSFAVNVALAKLFGTFNDEELPAVNNGAQVIPGTIESLFFIHMVDVDLITLVTLVIGTSLGGLIGGLVVSRLHKQAIRLAMLCCFLLIIFLLIGNQFHWLPMDGSLLELRSSRLLAGFLAVVLCGALTSVGIGLFVMIQGVLFLLGVSPLIAFPIMMTAGAIQQPITTLVFLKQNKIPLKKTLLLSLSGCLGVFIALPLVTHLTASWLHILLLAILIYNFIAIGRTYLKTRRALQAGDARRDTIPVYN